MTAKQNSIKLIPSFHNVHVHPEVNDASHINKGQQVPGRLCSIGRLQFKSHHKDLENTRDTGSCLDHGGSLP